MEEQFYFLWPAVLKKCFRYRVPLLGGVIALAPIYSCACYLLKIPGGGYGTLPAVADNLAVGCLLAILASRLPKIGRISAFAMLIAVLLIPQFAADTRGRTLVMLFVLWPVLHVAIAGLILHVIQNPYKILNVEPIVFLGRISYSLYLWQQLFFFRTEPWPAYVTLPLALGFACASYFLVEQPMLRLRDARQDAAIRARLHFAMAGD